MRKIKETNNSVTYISNRGHTLTIRCHYPKRNPPNAVEIITDALAHIGIFDGLNFTSENEQVANTDRLKSQ